MTCMRTVVALLKLQSAMYVVNCTQQTLQYSNDHVHVSKHPNKTFSMINGWL